MSRSFWKVIPSMTWRGRPVPAGLRPWPRPSLAESAFFVPDGLVSPYLRVKRSMRPAVSISRCLPVKNGWQVEQISSRSSFLVERVVQVAPQAQWTFTTA